MTYLPRPVICALGQTGNEQSKDKRLYLKLNGISISLVLKDIQTIRKSFDKRIKGLVKAVLVLFQRNNINPLGPFRIRRKLILPSRFQRKEKQY